MIMKDLVTAKERTTFPKNRSFKNLIINIFVFVSLFSLSLASGDYSNV